MYEDYRYHCRAVSKEINAVKTLYYSNRVEECQNNTKSLHRINSTLLVNQHQITLPSTKNDEELANDLMLILLKRLIKLERILLRSGVFKMSH